MTKDRTPRRFKTGEVVSKMDKTITVRIDSVVRTAYRRPLSEAKYKPDENNQCNIGDLVKIMKHALEQRQEVESGRVLQESQDPQ